jgi:hypothetical protein
MTSLDGLSGHVSGSFEENYGNLKQDSRFTDGYSVVGFTAVKIMESDLIGMLAQAVRMVTNSAGVSQVPVDRTSIKCRAPSSCSYGLVTHRNFPLQKMSLRGSFTAQEAFNIRHIAVIACRRNQKSSLMKV